MGKYLEMLGKSWKWCENHREIWGNIWKCWETHGNGGKIQGNVGKRELSGQSWRNMSRNWGNYVQTKRNDEYCEDPWLP